MPFWSSCRHNGKTVRHRAHRRRIRSVCRLFPIRDRCRHTGFAVFPTSSPEIDPQRFVIRGIRHPQAAGHPGRRLLLASTRMPKRGESGRRAVGKRPVSRKPTDYVPSPCAKRLAIKGSPPSDYAFPQADKTSGSTFLLRVFRDDVRECARIPTAALRQKATESDYPVLHRGWIFPSSSRSKVPPIPRILLRKGAEVFTRRNPHTPSCKTPYREEGWLRRLFRLHPDAGCSSRGKPGISTSLRPRHIAPDRIRTEVGKIPM